MAAIGAIDSSTSSNQRVTIPVQGMQERVASVTISFTDENPQPKGDTTSFTSSEVPVNEATTKGELETVKYGKGWAAYLAKRSWFAGPYKAEDNKGISTREASKEDVALAKAALNVSEDLTTVGNCYTGTKHALLTAGVIEDYGDMPKGDAKNSIEYFDKHPEKFNKVDVKAEDLKKLPAGRIVVYTKDSDPNLAGHIAITNGKGQEMSDHTDNMKWIEEKGEDAKATVYELTDGWKYNPETKKLEFKGTESETQTEQANKAA